MNDDLFSDEKPPTLAETINDNYQLVNEPFITLSRSVEAILDALHEQREIKPETILLAREDIAEIVAFLPDLDTELAALLVLRQLP